MPAEPTPPAPVLGAAAAAAGAPKLDDQGKPIVEPSKQGAEGTPKLGPDGKPIAEEPKLGPDGKPIVEPKLGPDGKPIVEKPAGAPEKYEDFKAPDGVQLNGEALTEFQGVAKELNLPQESAQKLVDLAAKHFKPENVIKAQEEQWAGIRAKWTEEVKADKEFGGDNFDVTKTNISRFLTKFAGPDLPALVEVLNTGWGDNPALVRTFARAAKALGEDKFVDGSRDLSKRSAGEVLYPSQQK